MTNENDSAVRDGVGFWEEAALRPDKTAVVTASGVTVTYGELADRVNRLSHLLRDLGVGDGDHLAYLLGNQVEAYEMALACTQIGVLYTPVNRNLMAREVSYILEDSESKIFITDTAFADTAREAADAASLPAESRLAFGPVERFRPLRELTAGYPSTPPSDRSAGRPFFYTSGTTGRPKGVFRPGAAKPSLPQMLGEAVKGANEVNLTSEGAHLVQGPLHHSGPLGGSMNGLHVGATVVVMEKWNAEQCLQLIERYRVTATQMVPTMFQRLVALPEEVRAKYDVSSLRNGVVKHGSAGCPIHIKQAMIDWWGPILFEIYGGQEGRVTCVTSEEWLAHPGTVGRIDRLTEVKLFDENDHQCGPNEVGTIYARLGTVEYFKAPDKTASSRKGELFTLGDLGYFDDDGWLFMVDRRTDLIVSGGVNIYPAEIEAVILQHPTVRDVAVIGVPNDEWGHEVKAVVEPASMDQAGPELETDIIEFVRQNLARYKAPRSVDFRAELPRDALGKLRKHDLRAEYLEPKGS
jgi:long-chain acyl-CoA synthetase